MPIKADSRLRHADPASRRWRQLLKKPALGLALTASMFAFSAQAEDEALPPKHPDLPEAFQQLIPRGRIASVDTPTFVSAKQAKLPDEAWILGVEVDGQARAYSLNLLNHHEVVNDRIGELSFAAVW